MKFTFIGTSHGVPERNQKCTCTMIEVSGRYYFIDMGAPVCEYLASNGIDIYDVKAVFITHMHGDHTDGLVEFVDLLNWYYREANPEIYLPDMNVVKVFDEWLRVTLAKTRPIQYREIAEGVIFDDGFLKVTAIPTKHCVNSYGYLLEAEGKTVLFTGDLCRPEVDFPEIAKEIEMDMFVGEGAHFEATRYLPYLKECKTKAIYIHHYQPRKIPSVYELAEAMAPIPVTLLKDNDVIEI